MPRVVAYILRQLKYLRVCDMERLADGLQYYLHGPEGGYHPKMNRISNLKLTHFQDTASQELTEEMLQVITHFMVHFMSSLVTWHVVIFSINNPQNTCLVT